jgi:hypothetical protein
MILAGNVGSQGGIQNGYMYAILFGAVLLSGPLFLNQLFFFEPPKASLWKNDIV